MGFANLLQLLLSLSCPFWKHYHPFNTRGILVIPTKILKTLILHRPEGRLFVLLNWRLFFFFFFFNSPPVNPHPYFYFRRLLIFISSPSHSSFSLALYSFYFSSVNCYYQRSNDLIMIWVFFHVLYIP